jgi:DNA-binding transcriptional LysR family regulator
MDRIGAMQAFTRVAERRSFALAASDLSLPRSRASEAVQQLERHLGVRLLARTTRTVTLTAEGEDYYRRCLAILSAVDDAEAAVTRTVPVGPLRIDVHSRFAQEFLLPGLPDFLQRHPNIQLHIGEGDRLIDLVAEGVDCAIRVGKPADSGLVGRKLGVLAEGTFASPAYLARHGVPKSPHDLDGHRMIGFVSTATRAVMPLEFQVGGSVHMVSLPVSVAVSATATNANLARLGLGLVQVPRYRVAHELATGALVEVLADHPPTPAPVYLLYPEGRQLSPRVRTFIDWASTEVAAGLARPEVA